MADHAQKLESMAAMDGMIKVKVKDRDEPYLVPAVVLALSSEVWKVSLAGKFKESLTKELSLDITDATFSILLEFLLPSVASEATITEENVYVLTEVSMKYALCGLKNKCLKHLESVTISMESVEERLYQAIKFHEADASFFRSDLDRCKKFLIDKYLHVDACGILRRIHKRIGEESSSESLGLPSTPLMDQCMEVTWEVMDSTASRLKRARTQYWRQGLSTWHETRGKCNAHFPLLHACLE